MPLVYGPRILFRHNLSLRLDKNAETMQLCPFIVVRNIPIIVSTELLTRGLISYGSAISLSREGGAAKFNLVSALWTLSEILFEGVYETLPTYRDSKCVFLLGRQNSGGSWSYLSLHT